MLIFTPFATLVHVLVLVHCVFFGSTIQKGQSNTYRNIDKKAFDDSVRSGQKHESDYFRILIWPTFGPPVFTRRDTEILAPI